MLNEIEAALFENAAYLDGIQILQSIEINFRKQVQLLVGERCEVVVPRELLEQYQHFGRKLNGLTVFIVHSNRSLEVVGGELQVSSILIV